MLECCSFLFREETFRLTGGGPDYTLLSCSEVDFSERNQNEADRLTDARQRQGVREEGNRFPCLRSCGIAVLWSCGPGYAAETADW